MADQLAIATGVGQGASGAFQAVFNLLLGTVAGIDLGMRTTYASLPENFMGVPKAIIFVATGWVFGGIFFALKGNREEGAMHMLYMLLGRPVALASLWGLIPGASFSLFLILGLTGSVGWEFVFGKKEMGSAERLGGAFREHGLKGLPRAIGNEGKRFWEGPNAPKETEPQKKNRQKKEEKRVEADADTFIALLNEASSALKGSQENVTSRHEKITECNEKLKQANNTFENIKNAFKKGKKPDISELKKSEAEANDILTHTKEELVTTKKEIDDQKNLNLKLIDMLKAFKQDAEDMKLTVEKEGIKTLNKAIKQIEAVIKDAVDVLGNPTKRGRKNIKGVYTDIGDNLNDQIRLIDAIVKYKDSKHNDIDIKNMGKLITAIQYEEKEWKALTKQITEMFRKIKDMPRIFKQEVEKKSSTA